jgi:hypothetical protein
MQGLAGSTIDNILWANASRFYGLRLPEERGPALTDNAIAG